LAFLILAAMCMRPTYRVPLDNADGAGMLAHLHTFFVDGDLLYDNEYAAVGMSPVFAFVTPDGAGVVSNHWPAGATWIQAPAYLLARQATQALVEQGSVGASAQWVLPVLGVRALAVLLAALAVWGVSRWVGDESDPGAGRLAAAAALLGTPLLYYAAESPLRPHVYGGVVTLGLVWLWWRRDLGDPNTRSVALGALAGLAAAIRPQLAPLLLLAWHDAMPRLWRVRWRRLALDGPTALRLALASLAFAVWPATHLRIQLWMYGGLRGYGSGETATYLWAFLTSSFHGLLPWTPVLLVGVLGLVVGGFRRERGAWLLLALFAFQVWLDAGYRDPQPFDLLGSRTWAGGTSFGPRKLLDAAGLLVPGAIWLAREPSVARRGLVRWVVALAVLVACVPTVLLFGAAFVEPAVTQAILDDTAYREALALPLEPARWDRARAARLLPAGVAPRLALVVVLPLLAVASGLAWLWHRLSPGRKVGVLGACVLAAGAVAHLGVAALITRSHTALLAEPDRMAEAAKRLDPAHERAAIIQSRTHRRLVRARLGDVVPE